MPSQRLEPGAVFPSKLLLWAVVGVAVAQIGKCGASILCNSAADCSMNGECRQGACECDVGWTGEHCSTLNLLPAKTKNGLNTSDAGGPGMSWGGTVNHWPEGDGKYHMHVAQFVNHCGFNQWGTNSRIVHAIAETADGPFTVDSVVVPVWSHNPAVVRAPGGMWVLTYVANTSSSAAEWTANCSGGEVVSNSSLPIDQIPLIQFNYMMVASSPFGPWSDPIAIDGPLDTAVPPWSTGQRTYPNRNTNIVLSIADDNSMIGLWRRCCSPPPLYRPPDGNGASVIFTVRAADYRNLSSWVADSAAVFPKLSANGYEDPHLWHDKRRPGVVHAVFHDMVGGWHKPEFNNTQVGAHAFSADGGESWVSTGVAFNLTVQFIDGTTTTFIQRERPHIVLDSHGIPTHLVSGVTYSLSPTLPTCTFIQPIAAESNVKLTSLANEV